MKGHWQRCGWLIIVLTLFLISSPVVTGQAADTKFGIELLEPTGPPKLDQFKQTGPNQYQAVPTTVPGPAISRALQKPTNGSPASIKGWRGLPQTGETRQLLTSLLILIGLLGLWLAWLIWRQHRRKE